MKIVAKISTRSGKLLRTVALARGATVLVADKDAVVSIIDEATGKPVDGAHYVRHGGEVTVNVPDSAFAGNSAAMGEAAAGMAQDAAAPAESAPATAEGAGSGNGGGGGLVYGVLGGLAVAGGIAAAAGGGGGKSAPKDTTAPSAPSALALAAADDSGASNSDRITNVTSGLTITGTAEAGATVTLREGTTVLGTGTANSSGSFSIDVALGAGTHSLTATATDAAGNAGTASSALSITIDTTAPTVAISSSAATILAGQSATLTFSFSETPVGFAASDISVSGGTLTGLTVSPTNANVYTATLNATGAVTVSIAGAAFTDTAGNGSTAATLAIAYDAGASGSAIDGYIANAFVFRDADGDGLWDADEFHTTTDAAGHFSGLFGSGQIVLTPLVTGGVNQSKDISTGLAFTGQLSAPSGSSVVTPLTTIVAALAGTGATAAQIATAEAQVKAALGLDAALDLKSYDPIAVVAASTDATALANAIAVQKAAIQIANILSVLASASEAAGGTVQGGVNAAASAIATQVAAGGGVDLSNSATVGQIVQAVATASGSTAIGAQAGAISSALASVNGSVAQAGGTGALDTLVAIASSQIVAQQGLAQNVGTAVGGGTALNASAYQGAALTAQIDAASEQVQVIVPTTPTPGALGAPDRPVVDDGARINATEAADGSVVTVGLGSNSGVAAGDALRISIGGTVIKSVALTQSDITAGQVAVTLTPQELGADGTKLITASYLSASGVAGAVSLPALVTLDTVVDAPAGLAVTHGPLLTALEGAAGTSITGTVEAGSSVTVTLTGNGGATLVKQAEVIGTAFTVALSAADITQLGEGAVRYSAVATDTAGNISGQSLIGQYFYTTSEIDPTMRLDGPGLLTPDGDDNNVVRVTALSGGAFAVNWLVDANGDGDADALAIQRFTADGVKQGGVLLLDGISPRLIAADEPAFDLQALANGGYVLSYAVERPEVYQQAVLGNNGSVLIVGEPTYIGIGGTTTGVTFTLNGLDASGAIKSVQVTPIGGAIEVTRELLDQFALDHRLSLSVTGVVTGQTIQAYINAEQVQQYDPTAALTTVTVNANVAPNGFVAITAPGSNTESFQISGATATGTIRLRVGGTPLTGAGAQTNGDYVINGVAPDSNGVYRVPQVLLDQLVGHDYQAVLTLPGQTANSAITATVTTRAVAATEGIYVQTFDADGHAVNDSVRLDGGPSHFFSEDNDNGVRVTPTSDGGFVVNWVVDVDSNGTPDGLAVQRFAANGSPAGGVTLLTGISQQLLSAAGNDDLAFDMQALANGGYALTYALERPEVGQSVQLTTQMSSVPILGEPTAIYVNGTYTNAVFRLVGLGDDGLSKFVEVTPVNGLIEITSTILDQFSIDHRLTLSVTGLQSGQYANVNIYADEVQHYDPTGALQEVTVNAAVISQTVMINNVQQVINLVALTVPGSNAESFKVAGSTASGTLQINVGMAYVNVNGIANATLAPNGIVRITNVAPDENGVYRVPQAVLDQLVDYDYQALLTLTNQTPETTVSAVIETRTPYVNPEGVFIQTFDANGVALPGDGIRIDGTGVHLAGGDEDNMVRLSAIPGGGFAVSWVIDTDQDGSVDSLAVQRFDANGSRQGSTITLQGVPETLRDGDHDAVSFDFQALDDGSYVLSYAIAPEFGAPAGTTEGVYVMRFDAQGVPIVSLDLHLTGTAGNDLLIGDTGNDVLDGGPGADILTGGAGADLFILEAPHGQALSATDLITDFQIGVDHLQLSGGISFASLTIVQGDASNGAPASDSLIIDSGSGDILARLANVDHTAITAASFA